MRTLITGIAIAALFLASCKSNSGSSAAGSDSTAAALKRNKQTALNSEMALSKGDIEGVMKDWAPDFVDLGHGGSPPEANKDSIKAAIKTFFAQFPDFTGKNFVAVADSNLVIVTCTWSGTFKNPHGTMKQNGKSFKMPEADIFTFNKEGKIKSRRSIQSDATLAYQLGDLVPAKK